jgi:glutamate-1-semialdehyde 2,1-aminomutase
LLVASPALQRLLVYPQTEFFTETPVYDYRTVKTADTVKFMKYYAKLLQKGIFIPPSQFETCFLSSAHSQQDINQTVEVATTVLSEQGIRGAKLNR